MYQYGAQWIIWLQPLGIMSLFSLGGEEKPRQQLCCQRTYQSVICPVVPWSRGCGRDKVRLEALSSPCTVLERARKVFLEGYSLGRSEEAEHLSIRCRAAAEGPVFCGISFLMHGGRWALETLHPLQASFNRLRDWFWLETSLKIT